MVENAMSLSRLGCKNKVVFIKFERIYPKSCISPSLRGSDYQVINTNGEDTWQRIWSLATMKKYLPLTRPHNSPILEETKCPRTYE